MAKLLKKSRKSYFGAILDPFPLNVDKNEFSWKKDSVRILKLKKMLRNLYNKEYFKLDLSNTLDKPLAVIYLASLKTFDRMD